MKRRKSEGKQTPEWITPECDLICTWPNIHVISFSEEKTERGRGQKATGRQRPRLVLCWYRKAWRHMNKEEARKPPPLEPPEGVWPCWHLDLALPECVRIKFFIVLSHPVCGILLDSPRKQVQSVSASSLEHSGFVLHLLYYWTHDHLNSRC